MTMLTEPERSFHRAHAFIREFARSASSAAGEDPGALVELLRHTLPDHFSYEERKDGFFDRLESQGVPRHLVQGLRLEHKRFLDRLGEIERALAAGEDVSRELVGMADDLREHEWIESISAVRAGLRAPTDPHAEEVNLDELPVSMLPAVEALIERVHALAIDPRLGLLAGITIAVPRNVSMETVRAVVQDALSHRGIDFVEVAVSPCDGEVHLLDTRFRGAP
jgi:hypothetical protein